MSRAHPWCQGWGHCRLRGSILPGPRVGMGQHVVIVPYDVSPDPVAGQRREDGRSGSWERINQPLRRVAHRRAAQNDNAVIEWGMWLHFRAVTLWNGNYPLMPGYREPMICVRCDRNGLRNSPLSLRVLLAAHCSGGGKPDSVFTTQTVFSKPCLFLLSHFTTEEVISDVHLPHLASHHDTSHGLTHPHLYFIIFPIGHTCRPVGGYLKQSPSRGGRSKRWIGSQWTLYDLGAVYQPYGKRPPPKWATQGV
ncbi:hypothetical protein DPEC_G00101570 [Dallia pectoralis]|uniref:Uncharacterized protein n=1 Tax=Dallia pectoralis TaxID=75939 RepID=A0ACC2GX75_DALPE|nr:hypothetical protein DPEC_G00101570 [Dallia pectoralis]